MIHSTAIIYPMAKIAEDVSIGAYAVIGPLVEIDSGSHIGDHSTIYGPTTIGCDNQIFQHTTLGGAPQDLNYKGEPTRLIIGNRNTIREYASISRGSFSLSHQHRGRVRCGHLPIYYRSRARSTAYQA